MKKSTLISTLAMVVIVALALTTATFAWYMANNTVTAEASATAAVSSDANLKISDDLTKQGTKTSIELSATELKPIVPKAKWVAGTTTFTEAGMNGKNINASNEFEGTLYTSTYTGEVRIDNLSTETDASADIEVKLDVTSITYDFTDAVAEDTTQNQNTLKSALRIAIFAKNDGDTDFVYQCTLTAEAGNAVHYGDITAATDPATVATIAATDDFESVVSQTNVAQIASQKNSQFKVVIWLDGAILTQDFGGATISGININFVGTKHNA